MKICAYVQGQYSKQTYKNECLDSRSFVGLRIVKNQLEKDGFSVDWAGSATVHQYDICLVSLTSDCDWWSFLKERINWKKSDTKVLVGGAGVLHITPFTRWIYAAMFGRGEDLIVPLVRGIQSGNRYIDESIAYSDSFSENNIYRIKQANALYSDKIKLTENKDFCENAIGCNHKCLFCGYTWHRKFLSYKKVYGIESGLFAGEEDHERAMLDFYENPKSIDWSHLRMTAIDGFSERLRLSVGKPITQEIILKFFEGMLFSDSKPHQIKLYNICGYPTETLDDWIEFKDSLMQADKIFKGKKEKQWSIVLHNTPFRPMPATPMACAPAQKVNFRGEIGRKLGRGLKGNIIFQGDNLWSVESMGTDSLSTEMLSMIAHRGSLDDSENIERLCKSSKFWSASASVRTATLEKYFNMDYLFGQFEADTLPSRYLRTYAKVEKMWGNTPLEIEYKKHHETS